MYYSSAHGCYLWYYIFHRVKLRLVGQHISIDEILIGLLYHLCLHLGSKRCQMHSRCLKGEGFFKQGSQHNIFRDCRQCFRLVQGQYKLAQGLFWMFHSSFTFRLFRNLDRNLQNMADISLERLDVRKAFWLCLVSLRCLWFL